jgi:hypothetical protein
MLPRLKALLRPKAPHRLPPLKVPHRLLQPTLLLRPRHPPSLLRPKVLLPKLLSNPL